MEPENALRAKENENENGKMDQKTNSSDNAPDQSTIKDEIINCSTITKYEAKRVRAARRSHPAKHNAVAI